MSPVQNRDEWTERWTTPSDPHTSPPKEQTDPAGACETSHYTDYLKEGKQTDCALTGSSVLTLTDSKYADKIWK